MSATQAFDKECKRLAKVRRRGALRVTSAHCSVSESAVMVIAGMISAVVLVRATSAREETRWERLLEMNGSVYKMSGNNLGKMCQEADELHFRPVAESKA